VCARRSGSKSPQPTVVRTVRRGCMSHSFMPQRKRSVRPVCAAASAGFSPKSPRHGKRAAAGKERNDEVRRNIETGGFLPFHFDSEVLPALYLAVYHAFVPLYADLFRIRRAGHPEVRPPERRLARPEAHRPVPSLGRPRVRPRSLQFSFATVAGGIMHCLTFSV